MKQCPSCSVQYGDEVGFCDTDGKALVSTSRDQVRLCPHCANSIQEDAPSCPYCKADFKAAAAPQWPGREESAEPGERSSRAASPLTLRSKAILAAGFIVFALGVYLIGSHQQRSESQQEEMANLRKLQDRERNIKALEAQLKQARQELEANKAQIAALTTKLQESRSEVSKAQERLASVTREAARQAPNRAPSTARAAERPAPAPRPATPAARRAAEPGVYEVIRATTVRQGPSAGSQALAMIGKGTKVTVVRASGEWLEVRSRQGKPPGFIRVDDAMFVSRVD
jgi:cytoskeletal protein RodZ